MPQFMSCSDLCERLMLQAEMMELRADDKAPGEGIVLDCHMEKGLGIVLNVLVRWGQLKPGDHIVVGQHYGRVRTCLTITSFVFLAF